MPSTDLNLSYAINFDPFSHATASAMLYRERGQSAAMQRGQSIYERRREAVARAAVSVEGGVAAAHRILQRVILRGLQCSAFGVDLSQLRPNLPPVGGGGAVSGSLMHDTDVLTALRLLLFEEPVRGHHDSCLLTQRLWEVDQMAREHAEAKAIKRQTDHMVFSTAPERAAFSTAPRRLASTLHRDGFLKVDSWTDFGLDINALIRQSASVLARMAGRESTSVVRSTTWLPALWPLLRSERLAGIVRDYLGGVARVRASAHTSSTRLRGKRQRDRLSARAFPSAPPLMHPLLHRP